MPTNNSSPELDALAAAIAAPAASVPAQTTPPAAVLAGEQPTNDVPGATPAVNYTTSAAAAGSSEAGNTRRRGRGRRRPRNQGADGETDAEGRPTYRPLPVDWEAESRSPIVRIVFHETLREYVVDVFRSGRVLQTTTVRQPRTPKQLARAVAADYVRRQPMAYVVGGDVMVWIGNRWVSVDGEIRAIAAALANILDLNAGEKHHEKGSVLRIFRDTYLDLVADPHAPLLQDIGGFGMCPGIPCADGALVHDSDADAFVPVPPNPRWHNTFAFDIPVERTLELVERGVSPDSMLQRFFNTSLTPDTLDVLEQWAGLHLTQHLAAIGNPERFVVLQGAGGNGKGVMLSILQALIGEGNYVSFGLDRLGPEYVARLQGKVAMVGAELPHAHSVKQLALLKSLVSQEPITARPLYSQPFDLHPKVLITQATNPMPEFNDRSDAIMQRLIVLRFQRTLRRSNHQILDLGRRLAEEELDEILAWGLRGALRMIRQGGDLQIPDSVAGESKAAALEGVHAEAFSEHLVFDPSYRVSLAEVYAAYKMWCEQESRPPLAKKRFETEVVRVALSHEHPVRIKTRQPVENHLGAGYTPHVYTSVHLTKHIEVYEGLALRLDGLYPSAREGDFAGVQRQPDGSLRPISPRSLADRSSKVVPLNRPADLDF